MMQTDEELRRLAAALDPSVSRGPAVAWVEELRALLGSTEALVQWITHEVEGMYPGPILPPPGGLWMHYAGAWIEAQVRAGTTPHDALAGHAAPVGRYLPDPDGGKKYFRVCRRDALTVK